MEKLMNGSLVTHTPEQDQIWDDPGISQVGPILPHVDPLRHACIKGHFWLAQHMLIVNDVEYLL